MVGRKNSFQIIGADTRKINKDLVIIKALYLFYKENPDIVFLDIRMIRAKLPDKYREKEDYFKHDRINAVFRDWYLIYRQLFRHHLDGFRYLNYSDVNSHLKELAYDLETYRFFLKIAILRKDGYFFSTLCADMVFMITGDKLYGKYYRLAGELILCLELLGRSAFTEEDKDRFVNRFIKAISDNLRRF